MYNMYNNNTMNIYTSTQARNNFFEILNRIIYGNEEIYIKKSNSDKLVKLHRVNSALNSLESVIGSIDNKTALKMKKDIKEGRKGIKREVLEL